MSNFSFRKPASGLAVLMALAVLVLAFAGSVMAQETTGTLRGTVLDPNGAAVSGATVTVTSMSTGATRDVNTGGDGGFVVTKLTPGDYKVSIAASSGFKTKVEIGRASCRE